MTPYQVAKDTNTPQSRLSQWKIGRSKPKVDMLIVIAKYLGVSVEELIEDKGGK